MWVVKIGGSVARDPLLRDWLQDLSELGGGRIVVVPGGGGFADQVREHHAVWAFDEVVAHNMAVLAMVQYGMMMNGLCPGLSLAVDERDIQRVLREAGVAVWLPFALLREQADELTCWDVTSDSIAAWLSNRLNAEKLVLVKSCPLAPDSTLQDHIEQQVVDRQFSRHTRGAPYPITLLHKSDLARMRDLLLYSSGS
ncbi:amino acid kinase family protein [Cupriavidus necator]